MERQIKDMKLNKTIDYTLLRTDAGEDEIIDLCEQAKSHGYASVCVNPSYVKFCAHQLAGTDVKVCAVVGFPLGQTTEHVKAYEASEALQNGASEIDAVMNVPLLKNVFAREKHKDKAISHYVAGLKRFVKSCHRRKKDCTIKLILECCLLTDDEKSWRVNVQKRRDSTLSRHRPASAREAQRLKMSRFCARRLANGLVSKLQAASEPRKMRSK